MDRFRDFADAGQQLSERLRDELTAQQPVIFCPVEPNGSKVLAGIDTSGATVVPLTVERSDEGVQVRLPEPADLAGACVVVIDDGVETGTVARAVATVLRQLHPAHLVLAVPVCPREASADLQHRYDQIVAVVQPLTRRDLRWHYGP